MVGVCLNLMISNGKYSCIRAVCLDFLVYKCRILVACQSLHKILIISCDECAQGVLMVV